MIFVMSWISFQTKELALSKRAHKNLRLLQERQKFETKIKMMHYSNVYTLLWEGDFNRYFAEKSDNFIHVSVVGTTNLEYFYAIMLDDSLVLTITEE